MEATSIKPAGYSTVKRAREILITRSSNGCRMTSKTLLLNSGNSLFEKYLHSCDVVYIFVGRTDLIDVNVVKTTGIRYESGIFNKMFY